MCINIHIMGLLEGNKREQEIEKINDGNFSTLVKEVNIHVQEAQRISNKMKPKRTTPRKVVIKMPKVKRENLKSSKTKAVSYLQGSFQKTVS